MSTWSKADHYRPPCMCLGELARQTGIPPDTLYKRMKRKPLNPRFTHSRGRKYYDSIELRTWLEQFK